MQKLNILGHLYNLSPMSFYTFESDSTLIKSVNNTSLGYKFNRIFTSDEIDSVWNEIKLHKRLSTISIFLVFIFILYRFIFPKFNLIVNSNWYIIALYMLFIVAIVCQVITFTCTKIFEHRLIKNFGDYEKVKFTINPKIDKKYYKLFKIELYKAFTVLLIIIAGFIFISPFKITKNLIDNKKYDTAIKIATFGSKLFPIAQEWYSMRGYANYKIGNYQQAIEDFDIAYKLCADGFNIMNFDNKIFIKYYLMDYKGALTDFDNEIQNADDENEKDQFLWDKAQFLYNIGEYESALKVYNVLLQKAESDKIFLLKDRLYLERAQVYQKLGKEDLVKSDLENAGAQDFEANMIPSPILMIDEETSDMN